MRNTKKASQGKASGLPGHLNQRLTAYALAAGVAGVGALALALPAQANIIVNDTPITIVPNSTEYITINGVNQLQFNNFFFSSVSSKGKITGGGFVLDGGSHAKFINSPRAGGFPIGKGEAFTQSALLASNAFVSGSGKVLSSHIFDGWTNKTLFLGFEFFSHAHTYFGRADLSVKANAQSGETGEVFSFAYEACAGQPILAGETSGGATCVKGRQPVPEPGTLALLALGAVGLFALRKKMRSAESG